MNEELKDKNPWWWPTVIDQDYIKSLRKDYPGKCHLDDFELLDYFDDGKQFGQFSTTWDHIGDAYEEYENLAKAFLGLVYELGKKPSDFDK